MTLTVVILTLDEAIHIARAIRSVQSIADRIFVIDSGSVDSTADIAFDLGAEVLVHPFVTPAKQFNWALEQLPPDTDWVFRLDADEVVSQALAQSLTECLPRLGSEIAGVEVLRRMAFLGRPIRWGGLFPTPILRVLRHGRGQSEDRWMDEHITVDGEVSRISGELLDDNLNSLSWWTNKHNKYATLEAVEVLNLEHGFLWSDPDCRMRVQGQAGTKRWIKEHVYSSLPFGFRAFIYFLYRYIIRLGFLDGQAGTVFHVLQGFWYRYLVDAKVSEVKRYMHSHDVEVTEAISRILNVQVCESQSTITSVNI